VNKKKLFVTGLPFEAKESHIKAMLLGKEPPKEDASESTEDGADESSITVTLLIDKERAKFLGRAIAEFESEDKAQEIYSRLWDVTKPPPRVLDRPVRVEFVIEKENPTAGFATKTADIEHKEKFQLFLKYLPLEADEDHVMGIFDENQIGSLKPDRVRLCKDRDGYSKGIGFLTYYEERKATDAIEELNGMPFWDKHIECTWAIKQEKRW